MNRILSNKPLLGLCAALAAQGKKLRCNFVRLADIVKLFRRGSGSIPAILLLLALFLSTTQALVAHPAFNIRKGLSALQQGDLENAETELQRARFAEPDNPIVFYNLGVVSYHRHDYQKAAGFFMQAASAAGKDDKMRFDSLYNLGNAAFKAGDYASAVSAYSDSIEVKADQKAEYNLEVARKKLQEQQKQEQQKNQQDQQQKDQNQQQKDQQKQEQNGQQDKSDQQSGDQSDQQQPKENQKSEEQKNADSKSGSDDQKQGESGDQQKDNESESEQQKAEKPDAGAEDQAASQTQQLNEQAAADPSENRQDVDMGADDAQKPAPQKPDASQRARALKNVKVNPYQIERLLQQMQERERQAQLHYRNEPQRMDEVDPFEMDAQQLQEWFENRGRRSPRPPTDEPDW